MNPTTPLRLVCRAWFADGQPLIPQPPGSVVGVTREGGELRVDVFQPDAPNPEGQAPTIAASGPGQREGLDMQAGANRAPAGTVGTPAGREIDSPPFLK